MQQRGKENFCVNSLKFFSFATHLSIKMTEQGTSKTHFSIEKLKIQAKNYQNQLY